MRCSSGWTRTIECVMALGAMLIGSGCVSVMAQPADGAGQVGRDQFPRDDAVILKLDQKLAMLEDGSQRYEEHKMIKLLNSRSYRGEADPRIPYRQGVDSLDIVAARAHLPDGTTLDAPQYAFNMLSPDDVAPWPAYENWRELVVNFSGVQEDVVLELHFVVTSKPGANRWLWGDWRLNETYPVVERTVTVSLPGDTALKYRADHVAENQASPQIDRSEQNTTWTWRFRDLDECGDETASVHWRERCGRLRFSNCPDARQWVADVVSDMEKAATPGEELRKFAEEIASAQVDDGAKVREIGAEWRKGFSFVHGRRAWSGRDCRPAEEVFAGNYGSDAEAAALLTAMFRAAGLSAKPMIAVNDGQYEESVPVDSSIAAFVVAVDTEEGQAFVEPATGAIQPVGKWAERTLHGVGDDGSPVQIALGRLRPDDRSRIAARLEIKIDKDGHAAGTLKLRQDGVFVPADSLRDDTARKSATEKVLAGILDGFEVSKLTSSEFAPGRFRAEAKIASKKPLAEVGEMRMLTLARDAAFSSTIHLPLARSERRSAVHLESPFSEEVVIEVDCTNDSSVEILPANVPLASADWGAIEQVVAEGAGKITIQRRISLNARRIGADDFEAIRRGLNHLRSDACRRLLLRPEKE